MLCSTSSADARLVRSASVVLDARDAVRGRLVRPPPRMPVTGLALPRSACIKATTITPTPSPASLRPSPAPTRASAGELCPPTRTQMAVQTRPSSASVAATRSPVSLRPSPVALSRSQSTPAARFFPVSEGDQRTLANSRSTQKLTPAPTAQRRPGSAQAAGSSFGAISDTLVVGVTPSTAQAMDPPLAAGGRTRPTSANSSPMTTRGASQRQQQQLQAGQKQVRRLLVDAGIWSLREAHGRREADRLIASF